VTDETDDGTPRPGSEPDIGRDAASRRDDVRRAAAAVADGELVVYPTETVYGLGGNALDPDAVGSVFDLKGRDRSNPLSLGVASVDRALRYARPTEFAVAFARAFLPGPVTVVVERGDAVPDVLTAGSDRVGLRVPDQPVARALLRETGPLTATSANVSGRGSVTDLDDLDDRIRDGVGAVIDDGVTPGTESTVVDPESGTIHRRGAMAGAIEAWLADPPV
jgi:L-threonylcarbamoyladenylate synthase